MVHVQYSISVQLHVACFLVVLVELPCLACISVYGTNSDLCPFADEEAP